MDVGGTGTAETTRPETCCWDRNVTANAPTTGAGWGPVAAGAGATIPRTNNMSRITRENVPDARIGHLRALGPDGARESTSGDHLSNQVNAVNQGGGDPLR
jgi:hypothetical protein